MCDTRPLYAPAVPALPARKYAWLERAGGFWHFLTNLFEDPSRSSRRWTDEQSALDELWAEGWVVVYPYNDQEPVSRESGERACGYGLMRVDRRSAF